MLLAGVTCASATAITSDEVIDLYHSVTSPYRINGAWLMNDATMKELDNLKIQTTNTCGNHHCS